MSFLLEDVTSFSKIRSVLLEELTEFPKNLSFLLEETTDLADVVSFFLSFQVSLFAIKYFFHGSISFKSNQKSIKTSKNRDLSINILIYQFHGNIHKRLQVYDGCG